MGFYKYNLNLSYFIGARTYKILLILINKFYNLHKIINLFKFIYISS
jgi:hypothetical protein